MSERLKSEVEQIAGDLEQIAHDLDLLPPFMRPDDEINKCRAAATRLRFVLQELKFDPQ